MTPSCGTKSELAKDPGLMDLLGIESPGASKAAAKKSTSGDEAKLETLKNTSRWLVRDGSWTVPLPLPDYQPLCPSGSLWDGFGQDGAY